MLSDHLGSTSLTTNTSGNVISELRYSAWGEVRSQAGTTSTGYQYTGQFSYAADFGLLYYNARWYDPSLGRFAQADTIVPAGVQGYDRYAYVQNNPLRYTDPSGHCATGEGDTCGPNGSGNNSGSGGCDLDCWRNLHESDDSKIVGSSSSSIAGDNWWKDKPACKQNDYDCLLQGAIDGEFDPFAPFIPNNRVDVSTPLYYNQLSLKAYSVSGYDLAMIAALGIDNPMTVYNFANAGVPIEWIEMTSPNRRTPGQAFFIQAMRLDSENVTNYEPNYLHAMMDAHPDELQLAKQNYYDALISTGGDAQTAYELWKLTDEMLGMEGAQ